MKKKKAKIGDIIKASRDLKTLSPEKRLSKLRKLIDEIPSSKTPHKSKINHVIPRCNSPLFAKPEWIRDNCIYSPKYGYIIKPNWMRDNCLCSLKSLMEAATSGLNIEIKD